VDVEVDGHIVILADVARIDVEGLTSKYDRKALNLTQHTEINVSVRYTIDSFS
jgi:hypothetical protein